MSEIGQEKEGMANHDIQKKVKEVSSIFRKQVPSMLVHNNNKVIECAMYISELA